MRTLEQLVDTEDPGITVLREWATQPDANQNTILDPDDRLRSKSLEYLQVTTRSLLGAVTYETGGVLIDHGRLHLIGSGRSRSILSCNEAVGGIEQGSSDGVLFVADDILGGLYALNGGRFGQAKMGEIFYLPADYAQWTPMDVGYSDFLCWCLTGNLSLIYEDMKRLIEFKSDPDINIDKVYSFYPFLWAKEGREGASESRLISADENLRLRVELLGYEKK